MRSLVLCHDRLDPLWAKTAMCILRHNPGRTVAIVDRRNAGRDAGEIVGPVGIGVPIVASVAEGLRFAPDELVIGIAPVGGGLPPDWRDDVRSALEHGLSVLSGLHEFLADDPALAAIAARSGASIRDVRRPPAERRVATGEAMRIEVPVVLTIGTDCASGKMTAAVKLVDAARGRGIDAGFVATGQTGMMIGCDAGVAVDAVVSDFVAGVAEKLVLDVAAKGKELIVVEGQGAITHPGYGQVALGLLLGSSPDALVVCHQPGRSEYKGFSGFAMRSLAEEVAINESILRGTTGAKAAAVALLTHGMDDATTKAAIDEAERTTGLVADDAVRHGAERLLDATLESVRSHGRKRLPAGAKSSA